MFFILDIVRSTILGVQEDCGMNYPHALTLWRASPLVGRINTLSHDDVTRKEARDNMHITPQSNSWNDILRKKAREE